jgi:histidinol-phosphatase (PHP family)
LIDYHLHTRLCKHASGEINEYVEWAIQLGLKEIAFTDHIPLPNNYDIAHRMHEREIEIYLDWLANMRKSYPEIIIRYGIEADYIEGLEEYLEQFLKNYQFDIVIMSIHFIKKWPKGDWVFNYSFPERTPDDIFKDYITAMIKGIRTELFDVVGHADLIKLPGQSLVQLVPNLVQELLKEIKSAGMAIEINSSGYRREINESYPGFDWLGMIKEYQIPITTGSDAHLPSQIALNFSDLYQALTDHGIRNITGFKQRKSYHVSLF